MRQKNQVELNLGTGAKGEAPSAAAQESEARAAEACLERPAVAGPSMEAVVERENLRKAVGASEAQQGCGGGGPKEGRRTSGPPERTEARPPGFTALRGPPTHAGSVRRAN